MRGGKPSKSAAPPVETQDGYFLCLLTDERAIFAAWKIGTSRWDTMLRNAVVDSGKEPYLFLEVVSRENDALVILDEHPVYGRENRWHLFASEKTSGRRIAVRLTYETSSGKREVIRESDDIDIPPDEKSLSSLPDGEKRKRLFDVSEAAGRWHAGSCEFISS